MFNRIKELSNIIFENISTEEIKQHCQDNIQKIKKHVKIENFENIITQTGITVEQKIKKIVKDLI